MCVPMHWAQRGPAAPMETQQVEVDTRQVHGDRAGLTPAHHSMAQEGEGAP